MSLYGDVHTSQGKPLKKDEGHTNAILIHKEGILFVHPTRKNGRRQLLPKDMGYLQELLLTEGLPAIRAIGQQWFDGFVDAGG